MAQFFGDNPPPFGIGLPRSVPVDDDHRPVAVPGDGAAFPGAERPLADRGVTLLREALDVYRDLAHVLEQHAGRRPSTNGLPMPRRIARAEERLQLCQVALS